MFRFRFSLAPWISSCGFLVMVAAGVWQAFSLHSSVTRYVRQDLRARAELAALTLEEPLRTQDFKRIHAFGDDCRERDIIFRVLHRNRGGVLFETARGDIPGFFENVECGDYRIVLGVNGVRLMLPFAGSIVLATVAFLVGVSGMLFVFFAFYRQRARLKELMRLEKERMKFITDFSHQLKTPLTGIIGAVDMMGDDPLAKIVKESTRRLDQLAMDLIDFHFGRH